MKLPIIKRLARFAEEKDTEYIQKTIDTLEYVSELPQLKENEIDVIGELLSNLYGSIEVNKDIQSGTAEKDALNAFMKRVTGSIDR